MKKLLILTLLCTMLFVSCKKGDKGDVGPAGPQGTSNPDLGLLEDKGTVKGVIITQTAADDYLTMIVDFKYTDGLHLYNGSSGSFSYYKDFIGYKEGTDAFTVNFNSTNLNNVPSSINIVLKSRVELNSTDMFLFKNTTFPITIADIQNYSYKPATGKVSFDVDISELAPGTGDNGKDFYGTLQIRNVPIKTSVLKVGQF